MPFFKILLILLSYKSILISQTIISLGNYSQYEIASEEKQTSLKKTQDGIDKQRKQIEESIKKMQIQASKYTIFIICILYPIY